MATATMHEGGRIEVKGLSKHFGQVAAVQDLTFCVEPGRVTGFLGPNGAGKTTTLRMLLALVAPTSGSATIGGIPYADLTEPQRRVGAALEASSFHPGRSARNHLRVLGRTCGMGTDRADELLDLVGLTAAARRRAGGFSLGMRQRLGLASALVGDPSVLILYEPANGLDPEGIRWLRSFLRRLAEEGRTVLVSSHMLSEVQQTVDDVVIISRGRLVHQSSLAGLEAMSAGGVRVKSPDPDGLRDLASQHQWKSAATADGAMRVVAPIAEVGRACFVGGVELHELSTERSGLEATFFDLVGGGAADGSQVGQVGQAGQVGHIGGTPEHDLDRETGNPSKEVAR